MCFLIACCGWTIDLIQRFWTFVMSCFICWAVCSLLVVTTLAGVALGYNYSLAEYIDMKEGKNVSVYLKRGIFASDYIHYGLRGSKPGGQTSTSMILITISKGSTTTTTTTTTTVRPVTTADIATSLSETTENLVRLPRSSAFPHDLTSPISSTTMDYGKTGNVPIYGFYKSKYETTTAMTSITDQHDIKAPSRTGLDLYWVADKERDKDSRALSTLSPAIGTPYYIPTRRSVLHKIDNDPFIKLPVPHLFYEKTSTDNVKPDIVSKKPNPLLFREAIKANNDLIQRLITPNRDEEYEYDIQGIPYRKKRNMSLNKITENQKIYNETKLIAKTNTDLNGWKKASEPTALQKHLTKSQFVKEQFTSEVKQTISPDKLNNLFLNNNNTQHKISKSVAETTTCKYFIKIKHSALEHIEAKTVSYSTEPIQRSHSKFLNILRNFNDDKK